MELEINKLNELNAYIKEIDAKSTDLIAVLHRAQHIFGYFIIELNVYGKFVEQCSIYTDIQVLKSLPS